MKYLVVVFAFLGFIFYPQNSLAVKKMAKRAVESDGAGCARELKRAGKKLAFKQVWNQESVDGTFQNIADLNGVVIWETAEFCKRHKRLPLSTELVKKVRAHKTTVPTAAHSLLDEMEEDFDAYFNMSGAPKSIHEVLDLAVKEIPEHFEPFRVSIRKKVIVFFRNTLRMPSLEELATDLKVESAYLAAVMGDPATLVAQAKLEHTSEFLAAQEKILKAFMRAVRQTDRPDHRKTQPNTPTVEQVFAALLRSESKGAVLENHLRGDFVQSDLERLLGMESPVQVAGPKPLFELPVLFPEGIKELEAQARLAHPGAFRNYLSDIDFDMTRAERAREAIENSPGFFITSATAGIPLVEEMYALMLKRAEERNYPILVLPTNQILEGLDKRLLENPRVHVITNTISNSALKIWQLPILAKNKNPFASLDQYGQFIPGQLVLVGHPQLAHRIVPTGSDHIKETAQWSPGSLSQAVYPYRMPQQGRTSGLAGNYHRNSFLVVEKADGQAGPMGEGVRNAWHVRPVEYTDDRVYQGTAGFNDMGRRYSVVLNEKNTPVFSETAFEPQALIVGDLHDYVADQRMLSLYRDVLQSFPSLREVYIHDPIDGFSHNHHEAQRTSLLIQKFRRGELDFQHEMMGLVQTTNAFLSIRPNIRVKFPDSNHSYWGRTLIDRRTETQSVVNGAFLAELTHAKVNYGVEDPLEWVFHHRNAYINSLPAHLRRGYEESSVLVSDPLRVQVIPFGQADTIGPSHRPVHLNFHGHQGANGARGSLLSHARGSQNSVVGDSHQSAILGGLMNVGTSTPKRVGYNNGGYSAWVNSFAVVYPDGTKQLLTYSSQTGTYMQRQGKGVLASADFFGNDPLAVKPTDNQLLPNAEVMDAHSWLIDILKGKIAK